MHRPTLPILLLVTPMIWGADLPAPQRGPLPLSLKRAVELATSPEGNTYIQLAEESVRQAKSRALEARAALLPQLDGYLSEVSNVRSLAALGLESVKLPFDLHLPSVAGPFQVTDIRATGTQSIFDFSAIRRWQAARTAVHASKSDQANADDQVSTLVAKAYLAALREEARLEAAKADVALAEAVLKQSENQKTAGTGTGIEVTRSKVQLANQQQRQLEAENSTRRTHLQLLRAIGLRLDSEVQLTDKLTYVAVEAMTVEQAKLEAWKSRADYQAQQERENSVRQTANAVKMERLPSIAVFGDYGTIGQSDFALQPTLDYGIALKLPVFDGGRRDARRSETASQYRQEKVRTNDLREQIELDVRLALDSLHSADEQLRVAQEGLTLSDSEMTQARRRYDGGVANGLEVTDAQTRLERARDNQIAALFNYNLARIDLGHALGTIKRFIQ